MSSRVLPAPATLGELADLVAGEVRGDAERLVSGVRSLEAAGPEHLSVLAHRRYREQAASSRAGALLVGGPEELPHDQIVCDDPAWGLAVVLKRVYPARDANPGVHPTAVVGDGCRLHPTCAVGPYVVIGAGAAIGARSVVEAGVVIGEGCEIGEGCVLHPRVVLYPGTVLGRGVIVHAGVVLGSDGFGYAQRDGRQVKVPQVGRLVVEDDVEIGANTAIDRATLEETRIGTGSKLDNLVQVGHNVRLGPGCVICGQAGIAGSAVLGAGVVMGGQSGSAGHLEIGDGVQVAAKSAVLQSVAAGEKVGGVPAIALDQWRRQAVSIKRLAELFRRVRRLEQKEEEE